VGLCVALGIRPASSSHVIIARYDRHVPGPGSYRSKSRTRGLVSMTCVAHTTKGRPCKQRAMVGSTVCFRHNGSNGKVIDAADRRLLLAQLMARSPDRHPWEIIIDATRRFDALAQVEEHILLHGGLTPDEVVEQLDRYTHALENAHKTAAAAITTKAVDQLSLAVSRRLELEGQMVVEAVAGIIEFLGRYLPPGDADRLMAAASSAARDRMTALGSGWEDGKLPDTEPVSLPFRLVLAPAIEGELVDDVRVQPSPTEEAAIARARDRLADPHEIDVAALTNDQLEILAHRLVDEANRRGLGDGDG
jgi:hypothetical protein